MNLVFEHNNNHNDLIKPPLPTFVKSVADFAGVCTKLIDLVSYNKFCCSSSSDYLKILILYPDSYRALIHYLKDENSEYHTY